MTINLQQLNAQRAGVGMSALNSADYPLAACLGGLNTRDSLASMDEKDAIELQNIIPGTGSVRIRRGSTSWATGLESNVETLAELHAGSIRKFIAAASSKIFDITATGSAIEIGTGYSNARWQYVKFGSLISILWMCNGQDIPIMYDGSVITNTSLSGDVTPTSVIGVHAFKSRLYLIEVNSQDFFYGGVNAVQGSFTRFPLSRVAKQGGNLLSIKSITRDGGDGADDLIAFFMTTGEIIVYRGSDPGDAENWSLVGRFNVPAPIADRGVIELGSDIVFIAHGDVIRLTDVLDKKNLITSQSKLCGAISDAVDTYTNNYGWQSFHYPNGNYVIFNIPVSTNQTYIQYGFNTLTGAAFKFTNQNSRTWGLFNENIFFGGNGQVFKANDGLNDNDNNIDIICQTAFSFLGTKINKEVTQVVPVVKIDGNASLNIGVAYDYGNISISQLVETVSVGSPWDTSLWDVTFWSPESVPRTDPYGIEGSGKTASIKIASSLKNQDFELSQIYFGMIGLDGF